MLVKLGVDISRLEYHCRKALGAVDAIYYSLLWQEAVITSTYDGNHSPGSLHYQNRAFDVRLPSRIGRNNSTDLDKEAYVKIKEALGKDFDVILEDTHIHIEYDPK